MWLFVIVCVLAVKRLNSHIQIIQMGKSTNLQGNVKCTNVDLKVLMGFNQIPTLNKVAVFEVILRHCTVKFISQSISVSILLDKTKWDVRQGGMTLYCARIWITFALCLRFTATFFLRKLCRYVMSINWMHHNSLVWNGLVSLYFTHCKNTWGYFNHIFRLSQFHLYDQGMLPNRLKVHWGAFR